MLVKRVGVGKLVDVENTQVTDFAICKISTNRTFDSFVVQNQVQVCKWQQRYSWS